jgi:hypothetical protein
MGAISANVVAFQSISLNGVALAQELFARQEGESGIERLRKNYI